VNGVLQSWSSDTISSSVAQNTNLIWNSTTAQYLARWYASDGGGYFFDGYLAEVNFIDGQALTPSSFGESNTTTGVWQPKAYTGTYGTNGFYLKFTDVGATSGSNTGYGKDFAGTNYWTTNNFGTTSTATTYDSMWDTPTPYADGGNGVGNYCVLNALQSGTTLSSANLNFSSAGNSSTGTIAVTSGKWYWEITVSTLGNSAYIGVSDDTWLKTDSSWSYSQTFVYLNTGNKGGNGSSVSYGATYTTGDVIGIALDIDAGTLTFYKNNTSQGTAFSTGISGKSLRPFLATASPSATTYDANFGQRPFTYMPPSGFKALNTQNLPTPTIAAGNAYMGILTWTGTSTSSGRTFTGLNFQPDLIWAKLRSSVGNHQLYDVIRGTGKRISSNLTDAETTNPANGYVSSFNSDGFTTSAGSTDNSWFNELNSTYVAWQWKANGSGSSNTSGSITSTVSANTTAGFSVVTWTMSNNAVNYTIGHGLGVTPSLIIVKNRSIADNWWVWTDKLASATDSYLLLNGTAAVATAASLWGTGATSSVIGARGSSMCSGANQNLVAYCFAAVAGYSAFGSYTGNGSADGPFVFTGFRPRYIMIKNTADNTTSWSVWDTARSSYNVPIERLEANASAVESSLSQFDILSNGFKLRANNSNNALGQSIIYAAFAENPFKYALAR
jgi:hypothetical protein